MKRKTIAHYEILRRLGSGGSGVVYAANDTLLQRQVVLKMLHSGILTAEQMRTTVLREARLASAIEHPNVCAIYEVGESGDEAYIAMQFVPGQPLDKLIERGPASLQLLLSVGIQIADGLQAAHTLGIFHRDLKPQNVMLTDGGLVKILDFGLARRLHPDDARFDPSKPAADKDASVAATYMARGGRSLPAVLEAEEVRGAKKQDVLVRDAWYPDFGLMTAREKAGSTDGMYVAVLASNNGRSHSHNDKGNFVVYLDGQPVTIDMGVEAYTAKTFGRDRYSIWTMQSAYHNLPTVGGVMQQNGVEFEATDRKYETNDQHTTVSFDIAKAYPKEAGIKVGARTGDAR